MTGEAPAPAPAAHPDAAAAPAARPDADRSAAGRPTPANETPATLVRVVAALILVGLALRPQILLIGPLVPSIRADLGLSHGVAGLLSSIPVLCMAVLAPLGPVLAASVGPRVGAALCVIAIAGFGVVRAFLPDAPTILLATVGLGAGMALIGPILPMVVRFRLPHHPAAGTGAYVLGLAVGGTIAAAVAVPVADAFGGWRWAMGLVSAAAFVSVLAWWFLIPSDHGFRRSRPTLPNLPWRRPAAWLIGVTFGAQAMLFYGSISWLASIYVERGWSLGQAAGLIATFNGISLVSTIAVPLLADRVGTRREQMAAASILAIAGILGITLTPGEPSGSLIAFGSAALLGLGIGAFFPLALTLPVDIAGTAAEAASVAALQLLVGYGISAASPFVLGVVRDATGGFGAVLWIMVAMAVAMLPLSLSLDPRRLRRTTAAGQVAQ